MAIIQYDTNPELSVDEKLTSLMASIQLALNERSGGSGNSGANSASDMSKTDLKKFVEEQIKARDQVKYPIGHILMSTENVNPADYLGFGTWISWGNGKVPVGCDAGDPDFDISGKTGGSKDAVIVSHSHDLGAHTHNMGNHTHSISHSHSFSGSTDEHSGHGHMPPRWDEDNNWGFAITNTNLGEHKVKSGSDSTNLFVSCGTADTGDVARFIGTTGIGGAHSHSVSGTVGSSSASSSGSPSTNTTGTPSVDSTNTQGVSGIGKNLQPYITCYMFKRTA